MFFVLKVLMFRPQARLKSRSGSRPSTSIGQNLPFGLVAISSVPNCRHASATKLPARSSVLANSVHGFAPGQRVGVIPAFSQTDYGTYGEEILVPAHAVVPCPPDVSSVTFAAVWMQYLTAYGGLIEAGSLQAGEHVLITAASSSVGIASIELALAIGAIPIAATRTGAKREALRQAGAAHVVATQEQDLAGEVRAITGGKGVRLVFDPLPDRLSKRWPKQRPRGA